MNQKKALCICGKSKNPPFCDHSHEGVPMCLAAQAAAVKKSPIPGKILLILLPYWSPLIPPHGIAHLKHFLQHHGCTVQTEDANAEVKFKQLLYEYYARLKEIIPGNKIGNYYNIGNDVLREHMMAHINYENKTEYIQLVKTLIYKTFYWDIDDAGVSRLTEVLDEFYFVLEHYIQEMLDRENPEVFGVSVFRDTLAASLFSFKLCRERFPHIKTVMGGGIFSIQLAPGSPNLEFFMEKTKDYIDKIIIGRGERPLLAYLQGNHRERLDIVHDTGEDISSPSLADAPDFSDFDLKPYQYLGASGSTGCPFRCSFCNVEAFYGKYRERNIGQTVDEMVRFHETYGTRLFFMLDELLNPIITRLSGEFIRRNSGIYWDAYLRVDEAACHMENTLLWRRGGFYRARIGIESGSQRVLDLMDKRITVEQAKTALMNLADAGIKTTVYIVIGHPGETEEDFQKTLDFVEELKKYIWEAECNPFTYFYSGQLKNDSWADKRVLLYPENTKDVLLYQTWIVDAEPSREETYRRVNRFAAHCKKLGISLAWSLADINNADKRWKQLHKNAVPSMFDLLNKEVYSDEGKHVKVKSYVPAQDTMEDKGEFNF